DVERPHLAGACLELLAQLQAVLRALAQQRQQRMPDAHGVTRLNIMLGSIPSIKPRCPGPVTVGTIDWDRIGAGQRLMSPTACDAVPPAGFDPAHPPPEGGALSPELRGPANHGTVPARPAGPAYPGQPQVPSGFACRSVNVCRSVSISACWFAFIVCATS